MKLGLLVFSVLGVVFTLYVIIAGEEAFSGVYITQGSKDITDIKSRRARTCLMTIKSSVVDIHKVSPGTKHQLKYEFKNDGNSDLVIERIASTCGCFIPRLKKQRYRPEEKGCIDVVFVAPHKEGDGEKKLTIWSNDSQHERKEITIKYNVVSPVEIKPKELRLNTLLKGFEVPDVILESKERKAFRVNSFSSTNNDINIIFDPNQKGIRHVFTVEVSEEKSAKELNGVMVFGLDGIDIKKVYLPYSTVPLYDVTPDRIITSNAIRGKSHQRDIIVKSNYKKKIEYLSSIALKKRFEVQEIHESERQLVIRVEPNFDKVTSRVFDDIVRIKFKDGSSVEVKCFGWFAK